MLSLAHRSSFLAGILALALAPAVIARSDEVILISERSITCTVLQENEASVAILYGDALIRLDRSQVLTTKSSTPELLKVTATESGLPHYSEVLRLLAKQSWAVDLHQIPATVIDAGVLRHVPYKSHRAASDCEINIYGDPAHPSCVEVGLYGRFLNHEIAKRRCIEFVGSLFSDETNRATILGLSKEKDLVVRNKLTFEVTPSTADDAYGGWWISAYNAKYLDERRATEKELSIITTELKRPRAVTRLPTPRSVKHDDDWESWHPSDFHHARLPTSTSPDTSIGGRVYVRGYYRKDGTYVRPHTRSR